MNSDDSTGELEQFREQARRLGFSDTDDIEADLESADDFIARMKARDSNSQTSPTEARPSHRRWAFTALAATAAAIIAVALVFRPGAAPVEAAPPPILDYEFASAVRIAYAPGQDPAEGLNLLSAAAATASPTQSNGPVQHHVSDNWFSDIDEQGGSVITPRVTETWLGPNGSRVSRDAVGVQLSPDGRGVPTTAPTNSPDATTEKLPAGTFDADFVETLPTSPNELRTVLLNHIGCDSKNEPNAERSQCLYTEIAELFMTYVVPPKVAEAMWKMLASEVGFTSLGSVEDRAGREGVGISMLTEERPDRRFILIGSTETGQLLGTEEILIKRDPDLAVEPPSVISFTTITIANRMRAVPNS